MSERRALSGEEAIMPKIVNKGCCVPMRVLWRCRVLCPVQLLCGGTQSGSEGKGCSMHFIVDLPVNPPSPPCSTYFYRHSTISGTESSHANCTVKRLVLGVSFSDRNYNDKTHNNNTYNNKMYK
jgi:hypothetical protein